MEGEGAGHVDGNGKSTCFFFATHPGQKKRVKYSVSLKKKHGKFELNTKIVLLTETDGNGATAAKCTAQVCNSADSSTRNSI